ncbi:MAG TPA: hypothetical protein VF898_13485 [Chloroflexota bacterium]
MHVPRRAFFGLATAGIAIAAILLALFNPFTTTGARSFPSHIAWFNHAPDADAPAASLKGVHQEQPVQTYAAYQYDQRAFPGPVIPATGYSSGILQAERMNQSAAAVSWKQLGPVYAPDANETDPTTGKSTAVSGRATSLAPVPSTCSAGVCGTMYLGTADGGVWKTTDAGATWTPLLDHSTSMAIGTVVLDPKDPNIVYVGTGEPNLSGDSHHGAGILRSTDGGKAWTTLGASVFANRAIAAIAIDPRTAGSTNATIYGLSVRAEAGGAPSGGAASRTIPHLPDLGLYVSHDGGKSWQLDSPAAGTDGGLSMAMDPANPDTIYLALTPDLNNPEYGGAVDGEYAINGIFKTTDGGKNWTHLTNGLPAKYFNSVTVALANSNPNVLYASYATTSSATDFSAQPEGSETVEKMYKSTDAGATWQELPNSPNACTGQCFYDNPVTVDPTNANVVYVGGTANYSYLGGTRPECARLDPLPQLCSATVMKSTNGGQTWADIGENAGNGPIHPDDHAIVLSPSDPNVVYTANDGGLFHSADGGKTWNDLNRGLATIQFNGLALSPDGSIYAGTQDNGTFKYTGSTTWTHIQSSDGGVAAVNPKNSKVVYTSFYGPFLFRSDGSGNFNNATFIGSFLGDYYLRGLGQFYQPYALAPSKPSTIYYGTYRIWRSNLAGGVDGNHDGDVTNDASDKNDWVPISFDLRCPSQPTDPNVTCNGPALAGRGISAVAVSPVNANVVVATASNGRVWITNNALATVKTDGNCSPLKNILGFSMCNYVGGPTWREIDNTLPRRTPTSITFAPGSSTKFYVSFSGFNKNTVKRPGHIFGTSNGGRTWSNLSGSGVRTSLPDLPFSSVVINTHNGHLYASSDYGVYASTNGGKSWARIDSTMPASPVYQLVYSSKNRTLLVATHGRGIWQAVAP